MVDLFIIEKHSREQLASVGWKICLLERESMLISCGNSAPIHLLSEVDILPYEHGHEREQTTEGSLTL